MPREFPRSRRVGEAIQRILSEALAARIRDPRLSGVTITQVEVSRDLAVARVFYAVLGGSTPAGEVAAGLHAAQGFFRSAVARELRVRKVPELRFRHDDAIARAQSLDQLIRTAVDTDSAARPEPAVDDEQRLDHER
ncbi:MAG: ribosome-binding factor A [Gammaproteobacteria bacterium]|nr:MAG: 30S ribosome-binding factor RbfA [Pseudomonadota bacterium]MBC6943879.1 30S ribosome-binding factor RbfA [Gammaproteobacteria bacterium]MCE7895317.1 30S ribosome-binding factor RbfA [Gammaproteobacteria bacterium PRO8]MDL1880195.1 30S ribosome-binding factor RbfA [Gammaproteobacteria bacterium PRO2]MCL4776183.1 30S ribosome-binding factor RbfA [Gammaproteobacteria bacterium]